MVVPSTVEPSLIVTTALAAPVPLSAAFDVILSVVDEPVSLERLAVTVGAVVSMGTLRAEDAALVLPATSMSVAVKLWMVLVRVPVTKLQAPLAFAVAVPSVVLPSNTVTVLLASAAPVSVKTFTLVMPSPTVPLSSENEVMAGAVGTSVLWMIMILEGERVTPSKVPRVTKLAPVPVAS